MAKPQYLTINEAERDPNPSLWVINTSTISDAEIFGDVLMTVPRGAGNGDPVRLKIEMTWLPQDLNMQAPKEIILRSIEFRQALNKNVVAIVSNNYAETVLRTDQARQERRRMADQARMMSKHANPARTLDDSNTEVYNTQDLDATRKKMRNEVNTNELFNGSGAHERYGVTEAFYTFAERLPMMSDGQAMNEIRARPTMKRSEMKCILAHLSGDQSDARDYVVGRVARLDAKKAAKSGKSKR